MAIHVTNERMNEFRAKILSDTEQWLTSGLRSATPCNGARQSRVGDVIVPHVDEQGHLDAERLSDLLDRLFRIADRNRRGDILIDLSDVRSATTTFIGVLEALGRYFAAQGRQLVLDGARMLSVEGVCLDDLSPLLGLVELSEGTDGKE